MTATTARTDQRQATFTQRTSIKFVSLPAQSASKQKPRSFVAALLKALSAFTA